MTKGRMLSFILVAVLVALLCPAAVSAATAVVSVEAPAEVESGTEFDVKVAVSGLVDFDSGNFDLLYDPGVVEVTGVSGGVIDGTAVPISADSWGFIPAGEQGRVRIIMNLPGVTGVTGSGYLAQIRCQAVGATGSSSFLRLSDGYLADKTAATIDATWGEASVTVAGTVTTGPGVSVSPSSLSFSATEGGDAPSAKTLEVWNSGIETLDWSASTSTGWLSLDPAEGSSTGERDSIAVSVHISDMEADTYTGSITVSAPGAAGSPRTVEVTLIVQSEEGAEQPPDEGVPPDGEEGEGPAEETAPPGEEEPEDAAPGGPGAAPSGQFPWYLVGIGVLGAAAVGLLVMMLVRRRRY
ncbi:MAG: BACON domain-containing protein [Chloroflexota bacterium]